jgi:hypothetical protein
MTWISDKSKVCTIGLYNDKFKLFVVLAWRYDKSILSWREDLPAPKNYAEGQSIFRYFKFCLIHKDVICTSFAVELLLITHQSGEPQSH